MFNNGVELNKDAWYVRLMHWMWGSEYYDFPNLCPLFWMVIGSICILPIYLIIRWGNKFLSIELYDFSDNKNILETRILTIGKVFSNICVFLLSCIVSISVGGFVAVCIIGIIDTSLLLTLAIIMLAVSGLGFSLYVGYILDVEIKSYGSTMYENWQEMSWKERILLTPYYIVWWLSRPIWFMIKWLFTPFKIFGYMICAIYKKSCPMINWK